MRGSGRPRSPGSPRISSAVPARRPTRGHRGRGRSPAQAPGRQAAAPSLPPCALVAQARRKTPAQGVSIPAGPAYPSVGPTPRLAASSRPAPPPADTGHAPGREAEGDDPKPVAEVGRVGQQEEHADHDQGHHSGQPEQVVHGHRRESTPPPRRRKGRKVQRVCTAVPLQTRVFSGDRCSAAGKVGFRPPTDPDLARPSAPGLPIPRGLMYPDRPERTADPASTAAGAASEPVALLQSAAPATSGRKPGRTGRWRESKSHLGPFGRGARGSANPQSRGGEKSPAAGAVDRAQQTSGQYGTTARPDDEQAQPRQQPEFALGHATCCKPEPTLKTGTPDSPFGASDPARRACAAGDKRVETTGECAPVTKPCPDADTAARTNPRCPRFGVG